MTERSKIRPVLPESRWTGLDASATDGKVKTDFVSNDLILYPFLHKCPERADHTPLVNGHSTPIVHRIYHTSKRRECGNVAGVCSPLKQVCEVHIYNRGTTRS